MFKRVKMLAVNKLLEHAAGSPHKCFNRFLEASRNKLKIYFTTLKENLKKNDGGRGES